MSLSNKTLIALLIVMLIATTAKAGNDQKRGTAGASHLLLNPWARSSGWAGANTAGVAGIEAMRLNVAGLVDFNRTQLQFHSTRYLEGTDINFNTAGFGQRVGEYGALGVSVMLVNMGDFQQTTYEDPDGELGLTFSPQYFNMGISYSRRFSDHINGGVTVRLISESIPDASAFGLAFDGGIMYHMGDREEFKFGVSLRNVGPKMQYTGQGFTQRATVGDRDYTLSISNLTQAFEMPVVLNIGVSYDFNLGFDHRLTTAGNFQSNTYLKDQYQLGVEYSFLEMFMVRGGFAYQEDMFDDATRTYIHTGWHFGGTVQVPLEKSGFKALSFLFGKPTDQTAPGKAGAGRTFSIDYSYQSSNPFGGTHTLGIGLSL